MNVLLCTMALFYATTSQVETSGIADTLLYIRTVPTGAQILLDGKPLGNSDGLFPVKAGMYKIVIDLEGHQPEKQQISIRDGKITRIELELKQQPVSVASHEPQQSQRPQNLPNPSTRTVMLPDVDRRDGPTVLDLASGQLVENIARDGDASGYIKLGKGDLWQDAGYFGTVREARAMLWDGTKFAPFQAIRSDGSTVGYGELKLPCRLLITTAEKKPYDVTILWMDGQGSARVDYRRADPAIVPKGGITDVAISTVPDNRHNLAQVRATLASVEAALERYKLDTGQYPTITQGLEALIKKPGNMKARGKWRGPYIKATSIPLDPWGHPYQYEYIEKNIKPRVWCKGPDHVSGTFDDMPPNENLANRMKSATQLSGIGKAMLIYANDHDDVYPPDLQALVRKVDLHPKYLVSPSKPEGFAGPSYIYIVGQITNMNPNNILAYENPAYCRDGINVLYLDSHVAWEKPDDFLQKLVATYNRLGRQMPDIQFQNSDIAESRESDIPRGEVLASRMKSASQLSGIGQAMRIYANDHDDELPPSLESLVSTGALHPHYLVSPTQPEGFAGPGYVYVFGQAMSEFSTNVVVYENPAYCQHGLNVLYLHGGVSWETPDVFLQKLYATYNKRLGRDMPKIQFMNASGSESVENSKVQLDRLAILADSKVYEMIINDLDEGQGHEALDLDKANQVDFSQDRLDSYKYSPNPQQQWAKHTGVDLLADYARNRWALMTSDLTLKRYLPNEFWHRLEPAEIQELVSQSQEAGQGIEILDRSGFRFYILDRLAKAPQTFAFETGQGALGVLEITEFRDKPRGMKIRYRLVKRRTK